jgi:hypothetical protein
MGQLRLAEETVERTYAETPLAQLVREGRSNDEDSETNDSTPAHQAAQLDESANDSHAPHASKAKSECTCREK